MTDNDKLDEILDQASKPKLKRDVWNLLENADREGYKRGFKEAEAMYSRSLAQAVAEARIKALTDVDNLNLLNDSDEWHEFYLANLKPQETE